MSQNSFYMPPGPSARLRPAALRAFLGGLIDYAGLFPPAKLPLDDAVTNFAAYRQVEDAWMLGRFIAPAAKLTDLDRYTDLFRPDAPFPISVLGSGGQDADEFLRLLEGDLKAIARFEEAHAGRVRADVFEVPLPVSVTTSGTPHIEDFVAKLSKIVDASAARFEWFCLEVGFSGDWRGTIDVVAAALGRANQSAPPFAMKIRCGGLSASAFPTPEQVAFFMARARGAGLPFKATAGLHHPVRHVDSKLEVTQHGFLNVFGAGVMAHALDLSEPALKQILRDERPGSFVFDETGFAFQDLRISTEQIRAARAHFALSFGSCSFDEPREDLRRLDLL